MAKTNLKQLTVLITLICCIQEGTGATTSLTTVSAKVDSSANINFTINLNPGEAIIGKSNWFFGTSNIAERDGTTLIPVADYLSRLTAYEAYGISLNQLTFADNGTYTYTITLSPSGNPFTATATLSVEANPASTSRPANPASPLNPANPTSPSNPGIGRLILGLGFALDIPCYVIIALLAMLAND